MPIKKQNMNMGILRGDVPLKSVMIGNKCVYGFDFTAFKITYPSVSEGAGLYIEVNGIRKIIGPTIAGDLEVHYGDRINIRTFAEIGYLNPVSYVVSCGNQINGTNNVVNLDGISIVRSTTYEFTVLGDSTITIAEATPAPKVNINVEKDDGIEHITIYYTKGAYEYSGLDNSAPEIKDDSITTSDNQIPIYLYSKISYRNPLTVAKEGYKVVSTTKNFTGSLTEDNQCTVSAVSQAGTVVTIVCPPIPDGVTEYSLYMEYSEFSRNINKDTQFYRQTLSLPSQASVELIRRHDNNFFFYKGDSIKIVAQRKDGYKFPSLGKQDNITAMASTKIIVLSDENVLVVENGEKGIPVQLVNEPLNTSEHVYLDVTSDYTNRSIKLRNPKIYVGDVVTVPLSPEYRIGTKKHRKPGVGFSADGNILASITFNSSARVQVPNVSALNVILQQGMQRIRSSQFSVSSVAIFSRFSNISPMKIDYRSTHGDYLTPIPSYGLEEYYLDTFDMTYSCKRYLLDAITSKYIKIRENDVPPYFSYDYCPENRPAKTVIVGSYTINADGQGVTINISKYDTDWVANSSDQAKLIPRTIII